MAQKNDFTNELMSALAEKGISMDAPAQDTPKPKSEKKPKASSKDDLPPKLGTDAPKPKRRGRPPKNSVPIAPVPAPEPMKQEIVTPPSVPAPEPVKPEEVIAPSPVIENPFGDLFGTVKIDDPEPEPVGVKNKEAIYAKMREIQDAMLAYREAVRKFTVASDSAISAMQDEMVSLEAMLHE